MNTPFIINHNYGDNYVVESGATVIAGGIGAAMRREQEAEEIRQEAEEQGVSEEALYLARQKWQQRPQDERMKLAILQMKKEKCPLCADAFFAPKQRSQYAYLCQLMAYEKAAHPDLPYFNKVSEFIDFLKYLEIPDVPSKDTIDNALKRITGSYPDWKIDQGSINDEKIAHSVASRFISLYRKGPVVEARQAR